MIADPIRAKTPIRATTRGGSPTRAKARIVATKQGAGRSEIGDSMRREMGVATRGPQESIRRGRDKRRSSSGRRTVILSGRRMANVKNGRRMENAKREGRGTEKARRSGRRRRRRKWSKRRQ
jgi:hypothetical protein